MNHVKFIDYKSTPGEKHLGIATVLVNDIIFLRYKISAGKNGGYFPNSPSYKVSEYGQDSYLAGFMIESNMLKEQVDHCLKTNVNRILNSGQPNQMPMGNPNQAQVHYPAPMAAIASPQVSSNFQPELNSDDIPF